MSVTSISDVGQPRYNRDRRGVITVTRLMEAIVSSKNDGPVTVAAHASVPDPGDLYSYKSETSTTLFCTGVQIEPKPGSDGLDLSKVFRINVQYSNDFDTSTLTGDEEPETDDPLNDPIQIRFGAVQYQIPVERDVNNVALKNAAGDVFNPPYMMDDSRPIMIITRNEPSFNASKARFYRNAINSDMFAGAQPKTVRVIAIESSRLVRNNIGFWQTTYEFQLADDAAPWNPVKILNKGFRARPAAGKPAVAIVDPVSRAPISVEKLLLADGTQPSATIEAAFEGVFLDFTIYRELPFSAFNFAGL